MSPGSSVVNILSVAAKTAFPNWSAYCMSKFALEGFSRCVREELRDRKVRVIMFIPPQLTPKLEPGRGQMATRPHDERDAGG